MRCGLAAAGRRSCRAGPARLGAARGAEPGAAAGGGREEPGSGAALPPRTRTSHAPRTPPSSPKAVASSFFFPSSPPPPPFSRLFSSALFPLDEKKTRLDLIYFLEVGRNSCLLDLVQTPGRQGKLNGEGLGSSSSDNNNRKILPLLKGVGKKEGVHASF